MKKLIASLISGFLLVFAFAPFGAGFVAWGAFVPFMYAADGVSRKKGFLLGFAAGGAFFLSTLYWVVHSMYYYGGVPMLTAVAVMLVLVLYMSLYWGLFGWFLAAAGKSDDLVRVFMAPAAWVALEYARAHLLTGFPWVLLGYSQASYLPLIQIADTTGVWGISFVIMAVNTALFLVVRRIRDETAPSPLRAAIVAGAILITVAVYGFMKMSLVDRDAAAWTPITAAVAQGSIDQSVKWDASMEDKTLEIYSELTLGAADKGARLIVWPETAIPFYYEKDRVEKGIPGRTAKKGRSFILTGSPSYIYNASKGGYDFYNSAYLLSPEGEMLGRYDKVHLVPFGEYVPLRTLLPFVSKLTAGIGDFAEGAGPVPVMLGKDGLGILICYEAIFPEIARAAVKNGATLLVNITNDGWFGRTSAPYQHLEMTVLRAVENRSYLLRSANTGISAVIDPVGRVLGKTGLFERTVLISKVSFRQGQSSFYTMYGDIFAIGSTVIACVFALSISRRR